MATNLALRNMTDKGFLKPGEKGLPKRFYSDFISRAFSRECLDRIGEMTGQHNVGFVSVQIARYYELAEDHGPETGFRLLSALEEERQNCFCDHFPGCEIISVEHVDINNDIICFRIPDEQLFLLGDYTETFSSRLTERLRGHFPEINSDAIHVFCGYARLSRHHKGSFYETLFRICCDIRRRADLSEVHDHANPEHLFAEILEKPLLNCLYQPVADLRTGDIIGWEAFVRGPEETHFHMPVNLFTHATEVGKVFLLDHHCRQLAIRNLGQIEPEQMLFMNIHMQSLTDQAFTPGLTRKMSRKYGLRPENIVLEFSENYGIRDYTLLLQNLEHYRSQGFRVAVDHSGHSTLCFISRIQPDFIKLDPSLIRGISYNPLKRAMAEGLVLLSEKIGAKVIAYSIETQTEARTLAETGVHLGQGHYIGRPAFPKASDCPSMSLDSTLPGQPFQQSETALSDLVQTALQVSPDTLVRDVKKMLKNHPPWASVVVVQDSKPLGLVMRYHLDHHLGTRYGVSLFYRREISLLMDPEPLIFETDQLLGEVARAAMNRDHSKIYDDIIVTADGKIAGTVSVQRMLDTLAKIEIRARENAETASRSKSEFLANMSHDIRTPMNAILGMADLLWESPLNPDQQKYVSVFRNAGESLLDLINDILDLSKVEAGQIELETVPFNLGEVVEKTCEVMALKAHEKDVELLCHVASDVPPDLRGDPARLRQIIANLIGNAVKFTQKGEIALTVQWPEKMTEDGQALLRFSVRDTGIGIPRDRQDTIFESFAQAHSSTSREYGGTGLGLTICKKLSELMGGQIWIESQVGAGSTFCFTAKFPLDTPAVAPEPIRFDNVRVLIADSNRTNRENLGLTLTHWGSHIRMAETREECLAAVADSQARNEPFQAILADTRLPGGGFELAKQLRDQFSLHQQTIMLIRSDDISRDMAKTAELGLVCNLVKPVRQKDLADAIRMALGMREPDEICPVSEMKDAETLAPMRILLAEDNENNQILFSFYLRQTPHTVEIVPNGKVCVEKYTSGKYDIVFMDIDMPVMDGYKATDAIRNWEKENGRDPVPIIALTAHALAGKHQESLDAGCTDHISKPFKKEQLLEALGRYAEVSAAPSQTGQQASDTPSASEDRHPGDEAEHPKVHINVELRELIPGFMTITRQEIETLEAAIREEDYENIRRLGHRIKGSCLCYGFNAAAEIARDVESAGTENDTIESIVRLADELRNYMECVEMVFA